MSYYMRYILSDERPVTLCLRETALRAVDSRYSIQRTSSGETSESGELKYGRALYAVLDIVDASTGATEELKELRSEVEAALAKQCFRCGADWHNA